MCRYVLYGSCRARDKHFLMYNVPDFEKEHIFPPTLQEILTCQCQ